MFKQIVLGILFMGAGVVLIYYSAQLIDMLGRNERAERNLGGTRNAIILSGFAVIVLGVLFAFGVLHMSSPIEVATVNVVN